MNIMVINDIHGCLDRLEAVMALAAPEHIEAICVLGNMLAPLESRRPAGAGADVPPVTPPGQLEAYGAALSLLGTSGVPVYLIPGAYDPELPVIQASILAYRGPAHVHLVHRAAARLGQHDVVAGFGGRLVVHSDDPGTGVQFRDWEVALSFEQLSAGNAVFQRGRRRVLLFATPPYAAHLDVGPAGHEGSTRLTAVIRTYQPDIVCCAGPAGARGVELIEGATVVNPGALAQGSWAVINVEERAVSLRALPQPLAPDAGPFHSILVALDDSSHGWRALELAAGLAHRMQARLLLVAAYDAGDQQLGSPYHWAEVEPRIMAAEALLARARTYVPELEAETDVLEGPAAEAILRAAAAHNVDLIVMGTRGLGPLQGVLGSVSQRVVHQAVCPVLLAPDAPQVWGLSETASREQTMAASPELAG